MGREVSGHWKKLISDPKFLGESDFESGQEITATITKSTQEEVNNDGRKSDKIALSFAENIKPMVLNATNSKTIVKLTGKKKVEEWKGTQIQIYYDPSVRFGKEIVGGVRVRPFPPKQKPEEKEVAIQCEGCGENIKPFGKRNTGQMASYTKEKYGKAMCSDCATKVASGQEGDHETDKQ